MVIEEKVYKTIPDTVDHLWMVNYLYSNSFTTAHIDLLRSFSKAQENIISHALNITTKTLLAYSKDVSKIKMDTKEHVILMIALFKHGVEVFDTQENFIEWLNSKNLIFDNKMPKNFLNTISGIKFVDDRLTAIEYGDTI